MTAEKPNPPEGRERSEEAQRIYDRACRGLAELVESGVPVDELLAALRKSFMITNCPEYRQGWDQLRLEMDAYIRSLRDGDAAVQTPADFVPSLDLFGPRADETREDEN